MEECLSSCYGCCYLIAHPVQVSCLGACSDQPYNQTGEGHSGPYHAHSKGVIGYAGKQVAILVLQLPKASFASLNDISVA